MEDRQEDNAPFFHDLLMKTLVCYYSDLQATLEVSLHRAMSPTDEFTVGDLKDELLQEKLANEQQQEELEHLNAQLNQLKLQEKNHKPPAAWDLEILCNKNDSSRLLS